MNSNRKRLVHDGDPLLIKFLDLHKVINSSSRYELLSKIVFYKVVDGSIYSNVGFESIPVINCIANWMGIKNHQYSGFIKNLKKDIDISSELRVKVFNALNDLNYALIRVGLGDLRKKAVKLNWQVDIERAQNNLKMLFRDLDEVVASAEKSIQRLDQIFTDKPELRLTKKVYGSYGVPLMIPQFNQLSNYLQNVPDDCQFAVDFIEYKKVELKDKYNQTLKKHELFVEGKAYSYGQYRLTLKDFLENLNESNISNIKLNKANWVDLSSIGLNKEVVRADEDLSALDKEINNKVYELSNKTIIAIKVETERWSELGKLEIKSLSDLLEPSNNLEPFIQLKQVIAKIVYGNSREKQNPFRYFQIYLNEHKVDSKIKIADLIDEYFFIRFKDWIKNTFVETQKIDLRTANQILSFSNWILRFLKELDPIRFFEYEELVRFKVNSYSRVTSRNETYSIAEREALYSAITQELSWSDLCLQTRNVQFLNVENPVLIKNGKSFLKKNISLLSAVSWLFENKVMKKINNAGEDFVFIKREWYGKGENFFINTDSVFYRVLKKARKEAGCKKAIEVFDKLNIPTFDNLNKLLLPNVLSIAKITGLNAEALKDLTLDSLVESDEFTGQPVVRYWKARSSGAKKIHLPLLDSAMVHIETKHYAILKKCFMNVKNITSLYRDKADQKDKERLILFYKSTKPSPLQNIDGIKALKDFVKKYNLLNEEGDSYLEVNFSRFRPTLVSDLLRRGVGIRTIQHILGHKKIGTTYSYLQSHDFDELAGKKVHDAISDVHKKNIEKIPVDVSDSVKHGSSHTPTPTCNCRDIMNPPEWIKQSNKYQEGMACTQFNKCSVCENGVITVDKLPEQFILLRKYRDLAKGEAVEITPYGQAIKTEIQILEARLDPKNSPFSKDELDIAEQQSYFMEGECMDSFGR